MSDLLAWLSANDGLATWLGSGLTAAGVTWALVVARSDARKANARALDNLLTADDAIAAMETYLADITEGRTAFDDVFDATNSWLSIAPFQRFHAELAEVDMMGLPSHQARRAVRRARATIDEISTRVAPSLDAAGSKSIGAIDLIEVKLELTRCRRAYQYDLPPTTFSEWFNALRRQRTRTQRLGSPTES